MIKRTLYFGSPGRLKVKHKQIVFTEKDSESSVQAPISDTGYVIIDHPQISLSAPLLQELNDQNCAVIFCGKNHMPSSLLLPLEANTLQQERFGFQINAQIPLKKNLWKQTIVAKVRNQAALLALTGAKRQSARLFKMTKEIKSGDSTNIEGQASRIYWSALFPLKDFKRYREGPPPNNCLNYGYAIIRAAVARALTGSGLLPTLGIHHHNRYNAFCLADDIMEPYRPFVDAAVFKIVDEKLPMEELTKELKARLLAVPAFDAISEEMRSPLMIAMNRTSASLAQCFAGEEKILKYPLLPENIFENQNEKDEDED